MEYFFVWYVSGTFTDFIRFVGVCDSIPECKDLIMSFVCTHDIPCLSDFVLWHYRDDQDVGNVYLRYDSETDLFMEVRS